MFRIYFKNKKGKNFFLWVFLNFLNFLNFWIFFKNKKGKNFFYEFFFFLNFFLNFFSFLAVFFFKPWGYSVLLPEVTITMTLYLFLCSSLSFRCMYDLKWVMNVNKLTRRLCPSPGLCAYLFKSQKMVIFLAIYGMS